ncbi:MAG: hypothetical protein HON81_00195, partial [Verrucomicrobia bacterium]|nr:hypothetical protein [Verrucomicrobiota bacterium]
MQTPVDLGKHTLKPPTDMSPPPTSPRSSLAAALAVILFAFFSASPTEATSLEIRRGDHVVWIGNTFAERMQYFGEIESRLHARYPEHDLVVRNLAWSADTVSLRPRPKDFGDVHHYLSEVKADVILVCYGFNETWDYGEDEGITRFEANLASFLGGM